MMGTRDLPNTLAGLSASSSQRGEIGTSLIPKPTWIARLECGVIGAYLETVDTINGRRIKNDRANQVIARRKSLGDSELEPRFVVVGERARIQHANDAQTWPAWCNVARAKQRIARRPVC